MDCKDVRVELVAYLDDELDSSMRSKIEAHLETCQACRAERDGFAATLQIVQRMPTPELTPEFKRRFWQDFEGVKSKGAVAWFRRPLVLLGAGAAAVLLVLVLALGTGTRPAQPNQDEAMIASHLELFSDYEAIKNLDVLEDFEFIESLNDEV